VAQKILSAAAAAGRAYLTQSDAMAVLGAYGLPVLPGRLASSPEDAAVAATQIGFPVAMKVESDDIVHKFDIKGVLLDIVSPEQAKEAYRTIVANAHAAQPRANIRGVFVQQMAGRGEEVILGLKRDEAFGPVLMFGLGGIFVEIFRDVSFRLAPVPADMVRDMMHEVRSYGMLTGARGRTPRDTGALEVCLQRLSQLAVECPQISELDINPLIVRNEGEGCSVADARIHV